MRKKSIAIILAFCCCVSVLGCTNGRNNSVEETKESKVDINDFNVVEEGNNMLPENYADYINKCANYYYNYVDVGDYSSVTYSIRKNASDTDESYNERKQDAIYEVISNNSNVKTYPKDIYDSLISTLGDNIKKEYEEYKEEDQSFGDYLYDEYGYKTIDEFDKWSEEYTQNYLKQMMIVYIIAYENKITVSSEDIINKGNEQAELYDYNGYEDIVTQFGNEMNTELGYAVLYTKVMDFLVSISKSE